MTTHDFRSSLDTRESTLSAARPDPTIARDTRSGDVVIAREARPRRDERPMTTSRGAGAATVGVRETRRRRAGDARRATSDDDEDDEDEDDARAPRRDFSEAFRAFFSNMVILES
jgi:hypothetical protein